MNKEQFWKAVEQFGNSNAVSFVMARGANMTGPAVELDCDVVLLNKPWANGEGTSIYVTTYDQVFAMEARK